MSARHEDNRHKRRPTTSPTDPGGAGRVSAQIGSDGVEPAIGVGGGLTVDSSGDLGLKVGPGVSVQVTPEPPAASDTTAY